MDITSALVGFAGGGAGVELVKWLLGRRRQSQYDLPDIARKYWERIDALEKMLTEVQRENAVLRGKVAILEARLGMESP